MRNILARIFSNRGLRGPVITLASASSVSLGIALIADPIITRLYDPEDFGVYTSFATIMGVLVTFSSLRYEDALMLEKEDRGAGVVVWLGLMILSFFVLLTALLSMWRSEIASLLSMPGVAPYLILVPVALLAMRGTKLAELWLTRKRKFRHISPSQISNTASMAGYRIAVGSPPFQAGASGLIHGHVIGNLVPLIILWHSILKKSGQLLRSAFSWQEIKAAARRYRHFALFSTPATVIAALVYRAPVFFIFKFFEGESEAIAGLYGMAFARVSIPLSYFSRAVGQVFFVGAAEAQAEGRLHEITALVHRRLVMVMLFPTLVILVCGPDLFDVVFSSKWRTSGVYAQIIVPWIFFSSICSPLTRLFDVTQRQRFDFLMGFVSLTLICSALILGGQSGNPFAFLIYLCAAGCAARLAQLCVFTHLAKVRARQIITPYLRYLLFSTPGLIIMISAIQMGIPVITVIASLIATAMYVGVLLWKDKLLS